MPERDLTKLPAQVLIPLAGYTTAAGQQVLEKASNPQWARSLGPLIESGRAVFMLLRNSARGRQVEAAVSELALNPQSPSNATMLLAVIGQAVEQDAQLADALASVVENAPGAGQSGFNDVTILNSPLSTVGNNNTTIVGQVPDRMFSNNWPPRV